MLLAPVGAYDPPRHHTATLNNHLALYSNTGKSRCLGQLEQETEELVGLTQLKRLSRAIENNLPRDQ